MQNKKKFKKEKSNKNKLPKEMVDQINAMEPEDLAIEAAREQLMLDRSLEQLKTNTKRIDLEDDVKTFKAERDKKEEVIEAKDNLAKVLEEHTSEDLEKAEEDLSCYVKSWKQEIRDRKKKFKFMMKTLKKHMESGALKSRVD